jgi:hypothetical protein
VADQGAAAWHFAAGGRHLFEQRRTPHSEGIACRHQGGGRAAVCAGAEVFANSAELERRRGSYRWRRTFTATAYAAAGLQAGSRRLVDGQTASPAYDGSVAMPQVRGSRKVDVQGMQPMSLFTVRQIAIGMH